MYKVDATSNILIISCKREYWIILPQDQTVLVYVLNEVGTFVGLKPIANKGILSSHVFPDLTIDMATIFAES